MLILKGRVRKEKRGSNKTSSTIDISIQPEYKLYPGNDHIFYQWGFPVRIQTSGENDLEK